jgi:hypothetical protein
VSETIVKSLNETDYYAWTQQQAAALRELAERRASVPLDLANLAEEVEDLGKAERNAVRSEVRRIIEHFLKLEFLRAAYPRFDWQESIVDARSELADKMSASLRRDVEDELPNLFQRARRKAALGLRKFNEAQATGDLPGTCPYALDDILRDDWYPPNRHGLNGEP